MAPTHRVAGAAAASRIAAGRARPPPRLHPADRLRLVLPAPAAGDAGRRAQLQQQPRAAAGTAARSEEHTSELQSLMRISYAVFCLKKTKIKHNSSHEPLSHYYRPYTPLIQ